MTAERTELRHTAADVSAMLAREIDRLVHSILPAAKPDGAELRVGSVYGEAGSSLSIRRRGHKAGVWCDFATGENGDALDLVAAVLTRGDLGDAYKWSLHWLGLAGSAGIQVRRADPPPPREIDDYDTAKRRRAALGMWLHAAPSIVETPVDHYLRGRGIDLRKLAEPVRALRFAPRLWCQQAGRELPAMVAAISNGSGEHVATHRTWLAQNRAGKWCKAAVPKPKKVLGHFFGGSIRLWRGASGRSLGAMPPDEEVSIGEGIESCLSVALAVPEDRIICAVSLGNMGNVELPAQCRRVRLLADTDTHEHARAGLQRAINTHSAASRAVRVARSPWGSDFNEALQ